MTGYSIAGLTHGIERAEHNIGVLQEAIEKERQTIADYKIMIDDLEKAEAKKAEAEAGVTVEGVDGNPV